MRVKRAWTLLAFLAPPKHQPSTIEVDEVLAKDTVKKSIAITSGAWFFKNVRHACDGGRRGRTMYFETVASDTVRPSFSSSPWIRGAPQSGLARLIRRIRSRTSVLITGRPDRRRLFHAQ